MQSTVKCTVRTHHDNIVLCTIHVHVCFSGKGSHHWYNYDGRSIVHVDMYMYQ